MKDIEIRNNKGEWHNTKGPAHVEYYNNGNISLEYYYKNGERHNENKPATISYYKNGNISYGAYWINGKRHNENGPAVIYYYENGNKRYEEYYINGINVTEILKEWHKQNNISKNNITSKQKILRKLQIGI